MSGHSVGEGPPDENDRFEPSSWWWLISIVLAAVGSFALLSVHLILTAVNANAWAWTLLVVPAILFCSSGVALFVGSDIPARERLAAARTGVFGYSPRE